MAGRVMEKARKKSRMRARARTKRRATKPSRAAAEETVGEAGAQLALAAVAGEDAGELAGEDAAVVRPRGGGGGHLDLGGPPGLAQHPVLHAAQHHDSGEGAAAEELADADLHLGSLGVGEAQGEALPGVEIAADPGVSVEAVVAGQGEMAAAAVLTPHARSGFLGPRRERRWLGGRRRRHLHS